MGWVGKVRSRGCVEVEQQQRGLIRSDRWLTSVLAKAACAARSLGGVRRFANVRIHQDLADAKVTCGERGERFRRAIQIDSVIDQVIQPRRPGGDPSGRIPELLRGVVKLPMILRS